MSCLRPHWPYLIFSPNVRVPTRVVEAELAQLRHLVAARAGWTHLESDRKAGSVCVVRETQLETDRRLLRNRIVQIQSRPKELKSSVSRAAPRIKADVPTVSLVGYTNAGNPIPFQSYH